MVPKDPKSIAFVTIQAVLLGLLIFLPGAVAIPAWQHYVAKALELIGAVILVIAIYNLRRSLSVFPMPVPNGQLAITGLYRYTRHPMYTGVLSLSLGLAMGSGQLGKYALVVALYFLFNAKARYEERLLAQKYPNYASYAAKTPRFIPQPWKTLA